MHLRVLSFLSTSPPLLLSYYSILNISQQWDWGLVDPGGDPSGEGLCESSGSRRRRPRRTNRIIDIHEEFD